MRAIDADKFKEDLMKLWDYSWAADNTATTVLKQAIHDLDNAPTVTPSLNIDNITEEDIKKFRLILQRATGKGLPTFVEDRLQGEWINHRNDNGHNIADCSLCGKATQWHDEDEDGIPRYCWYCGASMKGSEE